LRIFWAYPLCCVALNSFCAATSSWQTRMVDISLRPTRLYRSSLLPSSVSKYHRLPLVSKGSLWYFDIEEGKRELLYRRVGRNEISTIRVCQELVAAQKEFSATQHNGYAQKILSDEGQHNG